MRIKSRIDVHGHYFPPAYEELLKRHQITLLDGAPKPNWNEEIQLQYMERLAITYTALSLSSPHLHMGDAGEATEVARASNEYGAQLVKKYPGKFGVMASLPLPEIDASIREIQYCRDVLKVDGFALQTHSLGRYLGSRELEPVMQELNRRQTVVVLHPTQPSAVPPDVNEILPAAFVEYFFDTTRAVTNMIMSGTIRRYPKIQWIVPHAGAFLPILSDRLAILSGALHLGEDLDVMGDLAKLYYDLAGVAMPKQYELLRMITDDSHIMYGSDAPFTPLPLCERMAQVMDAGLKDDMASKVYFENPRSLFPKADETKNRWCERPH